MKKKFCKKCGFFLVKDNIKSYFNQDTGRKKVIFNLICPNYKQPYKYYSCYSGIGLEGHSAWTQNEENVLEKADVIFPSKFPNFINVSKCNIFHAIFTHTDIMY